MDRERPIEIRRQIASFLRATLIPIRARPYGSHSLPNCSHLHVWFRMPTEWFTFDSLYDSHLIGYWFTFDRLLVHMCMPYGFHLHTRAPILHVIVVIFVHI